MDSLDDDKKQPEKKQSEKNQSEKNQSEKNQSAGKKAWMKVDRVRLIKSLKICGAIFCLFFLVCGSPWLRSGLNPITCIWFTSLNGIEGSFTVTTHETPQFRLLASGSGKYRFRIYPKETLRAASRIQIRKQNPNRNENEIDKAFEISPVPAVTVDRSLDVLLRAEPLLSFEGALNSKDLNQSDALITLPKPLPAGDYLILAETNSNFFTTNPDRTARCFRVSNLGLIVKEAPDRSVIQAVDLVTLAPRAGVEICMMDGVNTVSSKSRTVADGTAVFNKLSAGANRHTFYANAGSDHATSYSANSYEDYSWNWTSFWGSDHQTMIGSSREERSAKPDRLHFATDRSAYRLGQTVLFKATTRCFGTAGLSNIGDNIKVQAEVDDPQGEQVWGGTLTTNKFGALNGSLRLSPTGKTGTYSVVFKYPGGAELHDDFEVIEYRKPEFEVKVMPVTPVTVSGHAVKVKVQAKYYFGAPVANAKVHYTVSVRPEMDMERSFEGSDEGSQGDERHFFEHSKSDENDQYFDSIRANDSKIARRSNIQGQAVTDQSGEAIVEINTQAARHPNSALTSGESGESGESGGSGWSDLLYVVNADVTDVGLKTVSSEGTALVVPGDFSLQVKTNSHIVSSQEPIEVTVLARGNDGKPITNHKISVGFCHWTTNIISGTLERKDTALVQTVITDASGKAKVKFTGRPAFYDGDIFAESLDDSGRKICDETPIYFTGSQYPEGSDLRNPVTLKMDKQFYRPGDTAKVLISTSIKDVAGTSAFIAVEGSTIYDYKSIKMTGNTQFVELPIRSAYAPNAYVTVTLLDRWHKPCTLSQEIKVYPADGLFKVAVTSDKPHYEPGTSANFTIKATRLDGTPAAGAEVNLAVADESIFALDPEKAGHAGIEQAIYAPVENRVNTFETFEGFSTLSSPSPELWRWDQACAAIPFAIAIPPVIALSVLKCHPAIVMPCVLGGAVLFTLMVTSKVSEQEVSKVQFEVRQSPQAPQAAGVGPSVGPSVRTDFRDTVFWSPSLITDSQGIAHASVKMPDNLTTWRATAYVIDKNRGVGGGAEKVVTSKNLIARLSLPRFYRDGDSAFIKGIVHNFSGKTQPVRLTLTCSPHFKTTDKLVREVTVADGESQEISWPVNVSGSGAATVKLEALGQSSSDALELKIPILSFGFTDFRALNGVIKDEHGARTLPLDLGPGADPKSARYELGLSASQIGPVLGNFSSLIDYPYGCTEQTMSRLIPSVVAMRLQKDLGVALPPGAKEKFESVRTVSMTKLKALQRTDGGWGWWTTDAHSEPYLTAYVLEGLFQLRQVGYPVDQKFVASGLTELKDYARTLILQPWNRERATDHARILYVLGLYGEKPQPAAVAWHLGQSLFAPPEALSYLTMAFHKSGNKKAALIAYGQLLALANKTDDYLNWDHTPEMIARLKLRDASTYTYRFTGVETTALALQAVLAMEPDNEERRAKIRSWILLQRGKDGWDNTKTTAQVFLSLLADDLVTHKKTPTNFKARAVVGAAGVITSATGTTGPTGPTGPTGKLLEDLVFNQNNMYRAETKYKCEGPNTPSKIVLSKEGSGTLFYDSLLTFQRKFRPGESLEARSMPKELGLTREFFGLTLVKDADFPNLNRLKPVPLDAKQIKAGETILMRVRVKSPVAVPYVMVEVPLPSGAEVISKDASELDLLTDNENGQHGEKFKEAQPDRWWWSHQDILDDRIVFFVTDFQAGSSEFTALLRMEMPGRYNINPTQMEGMYTNKVRAYSRPEQLEVLR